jgi:hypothetical protein
VYRTVGTSTGSPRRCPERLLRRCPPRRLERQPARQQSGAPRRASGARGQPGPPTRLPGGRAPVDEAARVERARIGRQVDEDAVHHRNRGPVELQQRPPTVTADGRGTLPGWRWRDRAAREGASPGRSGLRRSQSARSAPGQPRRHGADLALGRQHGLPVLASPTVGDGVDRDPKAAGQLDDRRRAGQPARRARLGAGAWRASRDDRRGAGPGAE